MVMTAYVMTVKKDKPGQNGEVVLLRVDDESAVQWIRKCHGEKDRIRARELMRMLGVLEGRGGWSFQVNHIKRVDNVLAEGMTR